jgi:hypothetical protein
MRNFQENPDLVSEFEYQIMPDHKRQNTKSSKYLNKIEPLSNRMIYIPPGAKFSEESRSGIRISIVDQARLEKK